MSEFVGIAAEQSCSAAVFLENQLDADYGLLDTLKICDLPFEVLDLILSKVVLLQMYFGDKTERPADRYIFMNLASVNGLWSEIIKRRHFKIEVVHLLSVYFRKAKKRSTIVDHNYEFLKDVLQPDILIDQLDLTGCLHKNRTWLLKGLRRVKDKNDELLFLLRNFNSKNYSLFVQCLCATDQNNAARVLQHGGETLKVHITNREIFQTTELDISLANKLLEEQKEYDKQLRWTGLEDEQPLNDVLILHAKQDQGIAIWLWFQTEDAWNKIKANSKDVLLEIVQKLFQRLMPKSTIEPHHVQLQYFNPENEFAKRKLLVRSKRGFPIKGVAEHVVVLKDEIYVTQKRSIRVYKNEVPYPHLKEIRLPEAIPDKRTPLQIAVCQMHNCLYAADRDTHCIYKIEPMHDHRMTTWLNESGSLLVAKTCSGDVLVLRRETEGGSLRVFSEDGVLKHGIALHDDINHKVDIVREIAPNVIALIYTHHRSRPAYCISAIFTMHLNRLGSIDTKHSSGRSINCLVSFSSCQLLIGIGHDYDDEIRYRIGLYDCHLQSIQIQNILNEKTIPADIYFSADQKELFILTADKLIYLPEERNEFFHVMDRIDGMKKQSLRFSNAEKNDWIWIRHSHDWITQSRLSEMERRLADVAKNFKIEIYKMNYEDDDYD